MKTIVTKIIAADIVNMDGWGAYNAIDWEGMQLQRSVHVHRDNLARRNFEHSNLIEGLCNVLKGYTTRTYISTSGSFYLKIILWKLKCVEIWLWRITTTHCFTDTPSLYKMLMHELR